MSIFSREKIVNSCPNAVKWLYLPPREVPPLSVPEKNPTFSQNLNGSTVICAYLNESDKVGTLLDVNC